MATERIIDKNLFFKKIGHVPHPGQLLYHLSKSRFKVPVCGRRFGKAEWVENLIPMADGTFKKMLDVQVGDYVFDALGMPVRVVNTTEVMYDKNCAKVVFSDGTEVVVAKDHLWSVYSKNARKAMTEKNTRRKSGPIILDTQEIQDTVAFGKESNYAVKLASPVQYEKQELAIDPYLLGLWLGDGGSNGTVITTADQEIVDYLNAHFETRYVQDYTYCVYGLRELLRSEYEFYYVDLDRNAQRTDKFVPEKYLISDVADRLSLLQGLMDTDGTIAMNGHCTFDNSNKDIADAVYDLVVSLGMKATRYERVPTYTYKGEKKTGKTSYRIQFFPRLNVFRLSRKLDRMLPGSSMQQYRFIIDVVDVPSVPVKCIQIANEDGLYLTSEHFIVTHNSVMAGRDIEPMLFQPNKTVWIVGPTYDLGEKEFRVIWDDLMIGQGFGKDKRVLRAYSKKQGNMFIQFPWNTRIEVRSADHPENLVGDALDYVIMSEAAKHKHETWTRYLQPALSDKKGGASFPTTPEGHNWLYDMWLLGKDENVTEYESWRFPTWENRIIYPGGFDDPEIQLLKRTMSPESFDQEIGADFTSFVGKIYPEWDVDKHVTNITFNPAWPNYIAFDWGYTNPLAAIEFQVSPDDKIFVWREHYKPYTRVEDHCIELSSRNQPDGYHLDLAFGDAADPEAAQTVSEKLVQCIADPNAKTNWREGVDLVRSFLRDREFGDDEIGTPQYETAFFVDHSCVNLIKEFNNYKAPDSKARNAQEVGVRHMDHALDALRYGIVHLFKLGVNAHLSDIIDIKTLKTNVDSGMITADFAQNEILLSGMSDTSGFFTSLGRF